MTDTSLFNSYKLMNLPQNCEEKTYSPLTPIREKEKNNGVKKINLDIVKPPQSSFKTSSFGKGYVFGAA